MAPPPITLFNTLSRSKETLVPEVEGEVRMYVCGPTVYSYVHLGNARTFTAFDTMVRYLRYRGYRVTYVRNYTDVDDKIIRAAAQTGESAVELAARFANAFEEDAAALGLLAPDVAPKVSEHLPEILTLIGKLVDAGVAYESAGDVYFQVSRFPSYAQLSGRNLEDLRAGERVTPGEQKREPLDFALWKAAKPGEPAWESPWGPGRPGWHIECSAMSARYLGESFDIHGGGLDLIFPHHENEIAQSEAASGRQLARYWMHCGFLDLEGAKMSKSLGNGITLREALQHVDPEALRLFLISTQYRNPLSFSDRALGDAEHRMEYFYETLARVDARLVSAKAPGEGPVLEDPHRFRVAFEAAMDDDFNTPAALAALAGLFTAMNELLDRPPVKDRAQVVRTLQTLRADLGAISDALGFLTDAPDAWLRRRRERAVAQRGLDVTKIEGLLRERQEARAAKDFARADAVREALTGLGVEVMDTATGTTWKVLPEPPA